MDYFLKDGYVERETAPRYFEDVDRGVEWQPEVYSEAADWARRLRVRRIIDIGCGYARKLISLHPEFEIVGLDYGPNITHCRQYGYGTWIEWDIERDPLPRLDASESVVVCADVIEHLTDPMKLLQALKALAAPTTVLSTPERDLTRGPDDMGPPKNPNHIREWNEAELHALLKWAGFRDFNIDLTESNELARLKNTMLVTIAGR